MCSRKETSSIRDGTANAHCSKPGKILPSQSRSEQRTHRHTSTGPSGSTQDRNSQAVYRASYWQAQQSQDHCQHGGSSSRSQRAPMLKRWLDEGTVKNNDISGHREVDPRGPEGMGRYLEDWDTSWAKLTKDSGDRKQS